MSDLVDEKPIPLVYGTVPVGVEIIPAPAPSASDELVEAWYRERLCNRALPTDLQNSIRDDVDALKARLRAKEQ
jgi:hypothetical protein